MKRNNIAVMLETIKDLSDKQKALDEITGDDTEVFYYINDKLVDIILEEMGVEKNNRCPFYDLIYDYALRYEEYTSYEVVDMLIDLKRYLGIV